MGAQLGRVDINEIFTYRAPVVAVIKDYRLGLLNLCLMLLIAVYILVYRLWVLGGYLHKPNLAMEMRATLRAPDQLLPKEQLPYCCWSFPCNATELAAHKQWCLPLLGEEASIEQANRFTVVTHKKIKQRQLGLQLSKVTKEHHFVLDIEHFTMKVAPTIFTTNVNEQDQHTILQGRSLHGRLLVGNAVEGSGPPNETQHELCRERSKEHKAFDRARGGVPKETAPCYIDADIKIAGDDIFLIKTLLRAMGLGEGMLDKPGVVRNGERARAHGFQVIFEMDIVSFEPWRGLVEPYYVLREILIYGSSHSIEAAVSQEAGSQASRRAVEDYGILFVFRVSGTLAHFTTFGLLEELSASFALLAASAALIKFLAIYVFPLANVYHRAIHRISPNMDTVQRLLRRKEHEVKAAHRKFFHHDQGSKEDFVLRLSSSHIDISSDSDDSDSEFESADSSKEGSRASKSSKELRENSRSSRESRGKRTKVVHGNVHT